MAREPLDWFAAGPVERGAAQRRVQSAGCAA
jgi:hypothetical protein